MARNTDRVTAYLKRNLDDHWTDAEANAEVLSTEIAGLDWACRATSIDWFLWQLGTKMLDEAAAEAVIDRDLGAIRAAPAVADYVEVGQHTLAAVLMRLDDNHLHISDPYQAVLFALSPLHAHRIAFDEWMATGDLHALAAAFRDLPGHAFLCMAKSFDDSAATMLARDGFWASMLGRGTGF